MSSSNILFGRQIIEGYIYSFVNGSMLLLTSGALIRLIVTKGFRLDIATITQYGLHVTGFLHILIAFFNLLFPGDCRFVIPSSILYSLCDALMDAHLLSVLLATFILSHNYKTLAILWITAYVLTNIIARIFQYIYIDYYISSGICYAKVNPFISLTNAGLRIIFVLSLGGTMIWNWMCYRLQLLELGKCKN
jgi:hypothetical protein